MLLFRATSNDKPSTFSKAHTAAIEGGNSRLRLLCLSEGRNYTYCPKDATIHTYCFRVLSRGAVAVSFREAVSFFKAA